METAVYYPQIMKMDGKWYSCAQSSFYLTPGEALIFAINDCKNKRALRFRAKPETVRLDEAGCILTDFD